jgi:hypothetical protein
LFKPRHRDDTISGRRRPGKRSLRGPDRRFVRGPEHNSGMHSCRSPGRSPAATRPDPQRLGTRPSAPLAARSQLPARKERPSPRELPSSQDDGSMNGLSASGLADLAGVTEAQVERLVELGILVPRDGPARSWRPTCRRSAWRWRSSRPGCPWRGSPRRSRRSAVIRVPGGGAVAAAGGLPGVNVRRLGFASRGLADCSACKESAQLRP